MKRPWLLFFALLATATVILLATGKRGSEKKTSRRSAEPSPPPQVVDEEEEWRPDIPRSYSLERPTAEEIPALIEGLFDPNDEESYERLERAGRDAVPALVKALDDPRTFSTRFDDEERPWDAPESPLGAICELLKPHVPTAAAKPLAKFVDHDDPEIRKEAAYVLAKIGTDECAEPVRKALADEDEYVRSYAMMGIGHGLDDRREMQLTDDVFDAIAALLDRDYDDPPRLLLRIDAERALPILLSDRYFSVENQDVFGIIEALNEAGRKIPREKLLPLLQAELPLVGKPLHARAFAEALKAYALNPDAAAEATIRAELDSPQEDVRVGAAEALAILGGVADAWEFVVGIVRREGFEALSAPQRRYYAVLMYDSEVRNGGHSQYFHNSSGELWEEALAGLEAMGSTERATILREAAQARGLSIPRESRNPFPPPASVDDLDDRYYAVEDDVPALLAAYALEHREHFGGPAPPRSD